MGFGDLDAPLRLLRGKSLRTGRDLLMQIKCTQNTGDRLLLGIDALAQDVSQVYFRYTVNNQDEVHMRLPYFEDDLQSVVHQDDYSKLIADPAVGLYYPGNWPIKQQHHSESLPAELTEEDEMLNLVRRPNLPFML